MTIRQSNVGRQRTISSLARALFDVKGDPELQRRAEEALLQANPRLAEGGLTPGAPIIVPDLRDPLAAKGAAEPMIPAEVARNVAAGAAALAELAAAPLDAALKEAADGAKALAAKATADAVIAARPDLKDNLAAVADEAKRETKRAAETAAKLRETIGRIEASVPVSRVDDGRRRILSATNARN